MMMMIQMVVLKMSMWLPKRKNMNNISSLLEHIVIGSCSVKASKQASTKWSFSASIGSVGHWEDIGEGEVQRHLANCRLRSSLYLWWWYLMKNLMMY